jgi:hypothetical protein
MKRVEVFYFGIYVVSGKGYYHHRYHRFSQIEMEKEFSICVYHRFPQAGEYSVVKSM